MYCEGNGTGYLQYVVLDWNGSLSESSSEGSGLNYSQFMK